LQLWAFGPRAWHASPFVDSPYALLGVVVTLVGTIVFLGTRWMWSKSEERQLLRKYRPGQRRAAPTEAKAN
jgi:hypothetical protein